MEMKLDYIAIDKIIYSICGFAKSAKKTQFLEIFRDTDLPNDYFYNKWRGCNKNFAHMFLNMGWEYQENFTRYFGYPNEEEKAADYINSFMMFAYNWNQKGNFFEIVFGEERALKYYKLASKSPQGVSSTQICNFYLKLAIPDRLKTLKFIFEVFGPERIKELKIARERDKFINEQFDNGKEEIILPTHLAFIKSLE